MVKLVEKTGNWNYKVLEDTGEKFTFQTRTELADVLKPGVLIPLFVVIFILLGVLIIASFLTPLGEKSFLFCMIIAVFSIVGAVLIYFAYKFGFTVITVEVDRGFSTITCTYESISRKDPGSILKTMKRTYEFQSIKSIDVVPIRAGGFSWGVSSKNYYYRLTLLLYSTRMPIVLYASKDIDQVVAIKGSIQALLGSP